MRGLNDAIWFCQCDRIGPGGFCAKHGVPSEEDRLKRKSSKLAYDLVVEQAKTLGWVEIERRVRCANTISDSNS